jgi:hypothetical protein
MALPLEPDVAPEDEVLDPFIDAPDVRALAMEVAHTWEEFATLRDNLNRETDPIRMAFVFETKPFVEGEVVKTHTIAKVTKASPLWSFLGEVDLVVQFRMPFWEYFDDRQRRAVLHHELSHIEFPRGKLSLREHDVEDFIGTVRRYGPYLAGRRAFVKAAEIWLEENPEPESEVDQARRRRQERAQQATVDDVMDEVVDRANRGEFDDPATGTTVRGGRGKPPTLPGERLAKAVDGEDPT